MLHGTADIHCSLCSVLEQMDIPKGTGLWRPHAGAEGKFKKEEAAERNHCVLTIMAPSNPCCLTEWTERNLWR